MVALNPGLVMRPIDATWDRDRWEQIPDDGNRYEVIDGVLYMSEVPSAFHQWVVAHAVRYITLPLESQSIGYSGLGPLAVFMPGCDPVQPDFLFVRTERASIIRRNINGVPDLIVEVMSPANWAQDVIVKRMPALVFPSTGLSVRASEMSSCAGSRMRVSVTSPAKKRLPATASFNRQHCR